MTTLITNGTIVNENHAARGSLLIDGDTIESITYEASSPTPPTADSVIDAEGGYVLPGIIDEHVHCREPGMTHKGDIESESRAAACGGVTSFIDMPNCMPPTTTLAALNDKTERARRTCHVNYAFFFGATNDNAALLPRLDSRRVPGVKVFMGSSTGSMLVDRRQTLDDIFRLSPLPIMTHCEDTAIINANLQRARTLHGDDPDITLHPLIRSRQACYASTALAVDLALKHHARLHVAHVTTEDELRFFGTNPDITAEATVAHLLFSDNDYASLGSLIKCNPAIKTTADRDALRHALGDGRIFTVATDHAPHLMSEKQGGAARAASGMPMVQFSLVAMLSLVDQGVITIERLVELMAHNPARLFSICRRGFLRQGYKADIVIVHRGEPHTLTDKDVRSRCGWSPLTGRSLAWSVDHTICNGRHIYNKGVFDAEARGEALTFIR